MCRVDEYQPRVAAEEIVMSLLRDQRAQKISPKFFVNVDDVTSMAKGPLLGSVLVGVLVFWVPGIPVSLSQVLSQVLALLVNCDCLRAIW